jgi:hypothetical protein
MGSFGVLEHIRSFAWKENISSYSKYHGGEKVCGRGNRSIASISASMESLLELDI